MANSPPGRKYLNEDELKRFFAVIHDPRDRAMFTLAYWRGLRASELGMIPWSAWDQKARRIFIVRLKHSLTGEFPLSPAEHKALTAWRGIRGNQPGPMFPSRESSTYTHEAHGKSAAGIGRGMVYILCERYAREAKLPEHLRHPHMLKHAIGTHLLTKGADVMVVKDWLGHADIKSTLVYSQLRNAQRDAAAQKVYEQG